MEGHEVRWSGGESDWSLVIGLRGAARHLLLRGAFVLALLAGSVLLAEWLGRNSIMFWIPAIIQIAIGVGCGKLLLNGLEDAAGFFSVLLPIVATIVIAAIAVLVAIVMPLFMTITSAPVVSMLFVACFAAAITMFFTFMSEVA